MQNTQAVTQRILMDKNELITTPELAHTFNCSTYEVCAILRFMGLSPIRGRAVGAGNALLWQRFRAVATLNKMVEIRSNEAAIMTSVAMGFVDCVKQASNCVWALLTGAEFMIDGDVIVVRPVHEQAFAMLSELRRLDILNRAARMVYKSRVKLVTPRKA